MQLNDCLRVCLLALSSRYPDHMLDINEELLGSRNLDAGCRTALDLIEVLERISPDLLLAEARLVVDSQKSDIYLVDYSEVVPALVVHCRGRLPLYEPHILSVLSNEGMGPPLFTG